MQKDKFNRNLTPGSFVIYGIRSGNSGGVRYGLILNSDEDEKKTKWEQRVQVLGVAHYGEGFTVSRPSTDNMIKVPENTFPDEVEEQLIAEWSRRLREKKNGTI